MPGLCRTQSAIRTLALAAYVSLAACGGEGVSGPPATASSLRIDAGNAQEGVVGQRLPVAIAVTVLDNNGAALPDVRVTFNAAPGAGTVLPTSVQTNGAGRAQAQWTLGTQTGTAVVTANVSGVNAATFTALVRSGVVSQVVASPSTLSLGVGDTLQLRANARDQFGNVVEQLALAWSTLEPAVLAVTSSGRATAIAQGTARAVVSTSGPGGLIADTVSVGVGPAGTSFCGGLNALVPAIGAVVPLVNTADGAVQCIGATVAGAQYALVLMNSNTVFGATTSLDALTLGTASPPSAALASTVGAFGATAAPPAAFAPYQISARDDGGFERVLRTRERAELRPHTEAAREQFGSTSRSATLSSQVAPPAVGSIATLNAQALSACSQPLNRAGRVVAVSQRALIVADTANPAGGYTDEEYLAIAAAFDTLTYPLDVEYFGEPTNVGGTGRITLFYTSVVNQLTPAGASFVVGGFFFARDIFPKVARGGLPACVGSNEREMMYLLVADPSGLVNGNRRSKADVTRLNRTTLAHELQHLINSGRRLLVTAGADVNEEVWLDEGLSHIAEELLYLRQAGFDSRSNLGLSQVAANSTASELFSAYAAQNFARWTSYLRAPESQSPYAPNDSLATRGATWHFLRYAAAQQPQSEANFFRQLVAGPRSGITNLTAAVPNRALDLMLRNWAIAIFADDFSTGLASTFIIPSWNFRSILPALTIGGQALGSYPLSTRTAASNVEQKITLAGGGSSYVRFSVPAAGSALLSVSLNGRIPPAAVQLAIVRYR